MPEKEIALLKEQIERLNEARFDLEAWKNQTIIFLERIFGKESSKVRLIRELHYDYSSWSLRDASGVGKSKDPVKFQAQGILTATIEELEKLGLPGGKSENLRLTELLEDELTGKQMKEIENLVGSELPDKEEKIAKILESLEKQDLAVMLARLLMS
ncbi:MAG: hypothetical protein WBK43_09305 [Prolixibacteraceae bacterium]|jgi:hypothetical protein|nr:hypothetical protein [Prolixibacteraceae bacterium]MDI9563332.1 hypothetical protein [Bacteroidota bacterium]NLS98666.1 hypothetical protein [Bacteroidales bacterium]OQB80393.1 MAG: hypothetical protein BWX87_01449 [Bacteroidetes bacterium ADurb.Bin123]HNU76767.1 hypothetical protein [Prolixibacteraceae bacterium]